MRPAVPVYVYQHQEFICKAPALKIAAQLADTSPSFVRKLMDENRCTPDGYFFSLKELTQDEIDNIPDSYKKKQKIERRTADECYKKVNNQEYEVDCKDGQVTYVPRKKKDKIRMLRLLIKKIAADRWRIIDQRMATLEQQGIRELLDSLENEKS